MEDLEQVCNFPAEGGFSDVLELRFKDRKVAIISFEDTYSGGAVEVTTGIIHGYFKLANN
jgi:hypothetical protein